MFLKTLCNKQGKSLVTGVVKKEIAIHVFAFAHAHINIIIIQYGDIMNGQYSNISLEVLASISRIRSIQSQF